MNLTRQEAIRLNLAQIRDTGLAFILERHAFELTRCPTCDGVEFAHNGDCKLAGEVEDLADWLKNKIGERPAVLGALVYYDGARSR